jgi:hypothetical protein
LESKRAFLIVVGRGGKKSQKNVKNGQKPGIEKKGPKTGGYRGCPKTAFFRLFLSFFLVFDDF